MLIDFFPWSLTVSEKSLLQFIFFEKHILLSTTYQYSPSNDPPHVFHFLRNVSILSVLHTPAGKEQHYVADDGEEC